jgi:hypothetical protein
MRDPPERAVIKLFREDYGAPTIAVTSPLLIGPDEIRAAEGIACQIENEAGHREVAAACADAGE